jgi:hypothetical protein
MLIPTITREACPHSVSKQQRPARLTAHGALFSLNQQASGKSQSGGFCKITDERKISQR